jgi:transposase InsO family protein
MDLCGRYIVAYRLGTEINATLVSDTVRDAFAHEKGKVADGLLLHSDYAEEKTIPKICSAA